MTFFWYPTLHPVVVKLGIRKYRANQADRANANSVGSGFHTNPVDGSQRPCFEGAIVEVFAEDGFLRTVAALRKQSEQIVQIWKSLGKNTYTDSRCSIMDFSVFASNRSRRHSLQRIQNGYVDSS